MPLAFLLRIVAFVCFVLFIVLIAASATAGKFEASLIPAGLAAWVLAELVGPARVA